MKKRSPLLSLTASICENFDQFFSCIKRQNNPKYSNLSKKFHIYLTALGEGRGEGGQPKRSAFSQFFFDDFPNQTCKMQMHWIWILMFVGFCYDVEMQPQGGHTSSSWWDFLWNMKYAPHAQRGANSYLVGFLKISISAQPEYNQQLLGSGLSTEHF